MFPTTVHPPEGQKPGAFWPCPAQTPEQEAEALLHPKALAPCNPEQQNFSTWSPRTHYPGASVSLSQQDSSVLMEEENIPE